MQTLKKFTSWLAIAAVLTILTILAHEIAHFVGALLMGAKEIKLHWADVTYKENTLNAFGVAVTWLAGPFLTHVIILCVWLGRASSVAALSLGLGACSRNLVLLPFTVNTLMGRDVSSFSGDEVRAAEALRAHPLPFVLVALALGVGGLILFLTRAYRMEGMSQPIVLFIGTIVGIVLWNYVGPVVLPGGRGYS